ncbi:MAG: HU family DNA-binding protein [Actinomycetota bacterium]|nr:HU family DNA-binding protein [Actinomycetota bacterium]
MNRKELVGAVAAHTGLDARDVDKALHGTTEVIEAVAAKGEQVTITGFAKFARVDRPARMARNPATGAPVKVKASKKAKITPLKGFKDAVLSPSAAPKLAKGVWPPASAKVAPAKKAPSAPSQPASAKSKVAPAKKAAPTSSRAASARATPARTTKAVAGRTATRAAAKKAPVARKTAAKKR